MQVIYLCIGINPARANQLFLFSSLLAFWCGSFLFRNRCLLWIIFWRNILPFTLWCDVGLFVDPFCVRKQENNRRMQRQSRCDLNKDANPKNARKRLKNNENKTKQKNGQKTTRMKRKKFFV